MATLVILEFRTKADQVEPMKKLLAEVLPDTRSYAGFQDITFYTNQDDPRTFVAVEKWDTKQAYQKYLALRTETGVMAKLGAMIEGSPSIRFFDRLDA